MRYNFIKCAGLILLFCALVCALGFSQHPQPQIEERKGMVGIQFSQRESQFYIYKVFKNSPAEKAGLKVGDVLLRVGGKDLTGLTMTDVVNLFNGDPDTEIETMVRRSHPEPLIIRVNRVSPEDMIETSSDFKELYEKQKEALDFINEELNVPPETRRVNAWIEYFDKVYGFQSVLLDKNFGRKMGAVLNEGLLVLDVKLNSPAFAAELEMWDIIYKIEGHPPEKYFQTNNPPLESKGALPLNITILSFTGEIQKKL